MKHFLFLILIISNSVFSQQKPKKINSMSINLPDRSVKFHVLNIKKNIHTNENLTYYWYAFNKILETKGGYDGKLLHANYTAFYLSENLEEKGFFDYGLKTGKWTMWYENGQLKEIINWNNGLLNGKSKYFDNKGQLLSEVNYKRGLLHGDKITYSDNKVIETKNYKNGKEVKIKEIKVKTPKPEKTKKERKPSEPNKSVAPAKTTEKKSFFGKKDKEEKQPEKPKANK